jgi:4-hydroxyphenylacetate 3-monooxygenase
VNSNAADSPAGARNGERFLHRLREYPRCIWHRGGLVTDATTDPAFRGNVHTLAKLYDLQWENADVALYDSPLSGLKVGRSFMMPKTREDLQSVSNAMRVWDDFTFGMMGRLPTYLNRASMGLAAGAAFLAEADPCFGLNAIRHYEHMRENDLAMTSTFSSPQFNRSSTSNQTASRIDAHVIKETDSGLVISGAKNLATSPISDELLVYSGTPLRDPEQDLPHAFIFAIPAHTPGLKFICRESMDYGRSHFDHPLGSRFDEMDAVVVFDNVVVPWENVFMYRDIQRCNGAIAATGAMVHMDHQAVGKNLVKTEFMLGLASLLVNCIGAEAFQHIYEKLAEIWVNLESMRALLHLAEAEAEVDEWQIMRPAADPLIAASMMFTRTYPRMVEIIQQIGASGLVTMPTERDLTGPIADDIKKYFQSARAEAFDRIPLFRLAWDVSLSAFGSRQVLYERFSRGDPIRVANAMIVTRKDQLQRYADWVQDFVKRNQDEAFDKVSGGSPGA